MYEYHCRAMQRTCSSIILLSIVYQEQCNNINNKMIAFHSIREMW